MKLQRIKKFFKNKVVLAAAVLTVAAGISGAAAANFGPDRPTKAYVQGMPGFDHVTFDSFTGVPNIGDERNFMTGKIATAPDGFYDPMNQVRDGNEVLVRVYVHNNADSSLNASGVGIAHNTRVSVTVPTAEAKAQQISGKVHADNATPVDITDTLDINANYPFQFDYEEGTARITTNRMSDVKLDDAALNSKDGVLIGSDKLDGNLPGCFDYVALVTFKVKIVAPDYNMNKTVRLSGEDSTKWRESAEIKPGDTVDWKLEFNNTGDTQLNNVAIFDKLPSKMSLVPNTTKIYNGIHPNGADAGSNNVIANGINVGNYEKRTNSIVTFEAKAADASQFECGVTTLVNNGYAKPENEGVVTDTANVVVKKVCEQPQTPTYSCDLLTAKTGDNRSAKFTVKASAAGGATITRYFFNFGDGTPEFITDKNVAEHTYAKDNQYAVRSRVEVRVNDVLKIAEGEQCATSVSYTTPTPPPVTPASKTTTTTTTLPNTGPGDVVAIFVGVVTASTAAYYVAIRKFDA